MRGRVVLVLAVALAACAARHAQADHVWRIHCQGVEGGPAHGDFQPTMSVWDTKRECMESDARAIDQWRPFCDQGIARACAEMERACLCEPEAVE
jgi:hypothetical protein